MTPRHSASEEVTLESWRDSPARTAVVEFVERVERTGVPVADRVAVFDNDGTLWTEKPMPVQLVFLLSRWARMAEDDPRLRTRQPYAAATTHDYRWLAEAVDRHYAGDDSATTQLLGAVAAATAGLDVETYTAHAREFLAAGVHPVLLRPFGECVYPPMLELMRYLEAHDFAVYIVSGGDRDFMRPAGDMFYGVPRDRVIGSSLGLEYGGGTVHYSAKMAFVDDGPEKPARIWSRIGRRPLLAAGNSDGDVPMLELTRDDGLRLLIHHDDDDREFAYDTGAEHALAVAAEHRWPVVSVHEDWARVFPDEPRAGATDGQHASTEQAGR
ncbi:HAD family hydrolase [Nocardia cyriacigeorgica]|uniref:HAD family hydrolase n=1 Tax=Nocardia cyriacigeorgica TaxID=135487 RepID=UPI002457764C|nr:HAD family hydrolase [Nocardia cyriacigeorgica]